MKKRLNNILITLALFFIVPMIFGSVNAGNFKFDPTTVTAANGATFQIAIIVEPGSDSLNSVDSYVSFDSSLLKATAVTAGSLFPTVSHDESTAGRVYIAGMVNDPASSISASGTVATITFQGLKDGTGTISFECNTSKIIKDDINATNVITCSQNGTASVTIGTGGNNTTPAPSQLPESGIFDNVIKLAIPGMFLLLLGSIFRLFI